MVITITPSEARALRSAIDWARMLSQQNKLELFEYQAEAFERLMPLFEACDRLEQLRTELRAETLSFDDIVELQELRDYIDPSDVELREAAGIEEGE
jgi:hypothetical protein